MLESNSIEAIFKASPLPCLVLRSDAPRFTVVKANDAFYELFEIKAEDLSNKGVFEVFPDHPQAGKSSLKSRLQKVIETKSPVIDRVKTYKVRIPGTNKFDIKYLLPESRPIFDESGDVPFILHCVSDAKEKVLSEKRAKSLTLELPKNQEHYRPLFDHHPDAVVAIDLEGKFISANPGTARMTGYTAEQLLQLDFRPIIAPEDLPTVFTHFKKAAKGELQNFNAGIIDAGGRRLFVNITHLPIIVNDEIIGVYGIAKDIREQISGQQELKQQKNQFQKLMDSSLDLICTIDSNKNIIKIGKAIEEMLGYKPEELEGRHYLTCILEEDQDFASKASHQLRNGLKVMSIEARSRRKDGKILTISWSLHFDEEDKITYAVGRDVTEINAAREKIENSEKRFRSLVQNSAEGIVLLGSDGSVLERSSSALEMLELAADSTEGIHFGLVHPEDLDTFKGVLADVISIPDHRRTIELRYRKKDHTYKWIEAVIHNLLREPAVNAVVVNLRDITERKIAFDKIRNNEKRFQTLLKNSTDGLALYSAEGALLDLSETGEKIFERPFEEMRGQRPHYAHPDDLERIREAFFGVQADPSSVKVFEFRFLTPDGSYKWIEASFENQLDEPSVGAMVMNFVDISERKRTSDALRSSEERYRKLFYNNPIPMWIYDLDTYRFLEVNQSAVEKYGYSEKEFLEMTILDIRPTDDIERLKNLEKNPKKDGSQFSGTWRHLTKEGELIFAEITSQLIDHKGCRGKLVLANDITEKIKSEEAIRKSEEVRALIMNSALDAIICLNTAGEVILWNTQAENLFGWSQNEMIGKELYDYILPKRYRKRHKEGFKRLQKKQHGPFLNKIREISAIDRNRREFPIEWIMVPFKQNDSHLFCAYIRDISERKNYITAIQEQNARLKEIAWIQSHIVRAPLSRIMGLIDLIKTEPNSPEIPALMEFLSSSAEELDLVIREITSKTDQIKRK